MAEKIAFVGLGIMGKPMAKNLMKAGYELYVYDLFPDPVEELEKEGAKGCKSAAEASSNTNITITMVQDGPQAESAILGENGVSDGASEGHLVDMSSIAPGVSQRLELDAQKRELIFLMPLYQEESLLLYLEN